MHFDYSDKVKDLQARLLAFMEAHIYPNEQRFFEFAGSSVDRRDRSHPTTEPVGRLIRWIDYVD